MSSSAGPLHPSSPLPPLGLCGQWVMTLLLRGKSNEATRSALTADDLPYPGDAALDGLRAEFVPKRFNHKTTKGKAVAQKVGVTAFFDGTPEAHQALGLLRYPRAREMTEAGLLTGVPVLAIAQTLKLYQQVVVPEPVIMFYKSAFFDTTRVTRAQLRVVVQERVRLSVMRMVNDVGDEAAARRAVRGDARTLAMNLASSPIAWSAVLLAMGFSPKAPELHKVVGQMENLATVRVSEALLRGGRDDEKRAMGYTSVLEKLSAIRQTITPPDSQLLAKLRAVRLRTSSEKTPTVDDLRSSGAEVSVDLGPPLGPRADEEDAPSGDVEDEGGSAT